MHNLNEFYVSELDGLKQWKCFYCGLEDRVECFMAFLTLHDFGVDLAFKTFMWKIKYKCLF